MLSLIRLEYSVKKLLLEIFLSVVTAYEFIGTLYATSSNPTPFGPQMLRNPKAKLHEILDLAKQILSPLTLCHQSFEDIISNIQQVFTFA